MKEVFCNGDEMKAPDGGDITCPSIHLVNPTSSKINFLVQTGGRCHVSCEASYPVPSKLDCGSNGWKLPKTERILRCDATTNGISPGAQIALIGFILFLVCVITAFYQKK